jgi:hypothetical protein
MMTNDVERLRARDNKQAVVDAILAAETESNRWRRVLAREGRHHPAAAQLVSKQNYLCRIGCRVNFETLS